MEFLRQMTFRRWMRAATREKQPRSDAARKITCRKMPLNDKNSGALTARDITEKCIRGQGGSISRLKQHVTDHVACFQADRRFDAR